ncbi:uncharacterized protein LOC127715444 [Mytilus californianus]|uniref:uncharacterized protein LOC127715444 n=1 Tax=Mytilus californianus TaxID=6549 RepID=UPI00224832EE|nr:uncharacterized protein LOC127715444 [Mytilus californianus]
MKVFLQTPLSFLEKKGPIGFSIKFNKKHLPSPWSQDKDKYVKSISFEFGLVEDSISREVLYPSYFSVSAFNCQNIFGVCLKTGTGKDLQSEAILKSETNSTFVKGQFSMSYRPKDSTFVILAKSAKDNTMIEVHRAQLIEFKIPLWPVFAAYHSEVITVSITIQTNKIGFDRQTLHPKLFISYENKTISNKMLGGTYTSKSSGNPFIYTRPKKFEISNTFQTMIDIDFVGSNDGNTFFKIGLREYKNSKFEETKLLECTKCEVNYFLGFVRTTGFCLSDDSGMNRIVVGNHIGLLLHFNRNGRIELYVLNNFSGYSYYFFQFEPFHEISPEFYIEKVNAKDIVISSSENTRNKHMDYH